MRRVFMHNEQIAWHVSVLSVSRTLKPEVDVEAITLYMLEYRSHRLTVDVDVAAATAMTAAIVGCSY